MDLNKIGDLSSLTPEEQELALKILKEYSDKGESQLYNELTTADYDEIPITVNEFIHNRKYLGNALYDSDGRFTLFPYWEKKLDDIFPTNTKTAYNTIILTGCLTGDTLIPMLNGEQKQIIDLVKEDKHVDEYVYSFDRETHKFVPGKLIDAFSTGVKKIYKITLDNGECIKATSNHKFLLRDNKWKSIDTGLSVGDSMMPFNRDYKTVEELEQLAKNYNHKIISIEFIGEEEVYDLTVERYHNFALSSGIVAHNSIGIGKTLFACVCLLYMLYRLLCLKNPYLYYGMQPIDKITISLMNITLENARGVALDKINQMLLASEWFMSHGEMSGTTNLNYIPNKHIELITASSNNQVIGRALFANFTD